MALPSYEIIYNSLKTKILNGEYPEDTLLPAEPVLEQLYKVSRTTVRKAVDMLTRDGYVFPKRGIGTVILKFHITQSLNRLSSMTETLQSKGYTVSLKMLKIEIIKPDKKIADIFEIASDAPVARISRIMCASGVPIALLYNYIPYNLVKGIENNVHDFISLYKFLKEKYFLSIDMSQDKITAENAGGNDAKMLEIPKGFALIHYERKCIMHGKCICYDIVSARHDMYEFETSLYNN